MVDSSVIVKWLNSQEEQNLEKADELLRDAMDKRVVLLTSELGKFEVGNALINKGIGPTEFNETMAVFYNLPIQFFPESEEVSKITFDIAKRYKLTYYDAAYVALAVVYDASIVTDNYKHQGKASEEVEVIALKDYKS